MNTKRRINLFFLLTVTTIALVAVGYWRVGRVHFQRELNAFLLAECRTGNVPRVVALLERGADPNSRNPPPEAWEPRDWFEYTFLDKPAIDPFVQQTSALIEAAGSPHAYDLIKTLLDHGARLGARPIEDEQMLADAVRAGDIQAVRMLLDHGIRADSYGQYGRSVLYWAADGGREDLVSILLLRGARVSVLEIRAAREGKHEHIVRMLEHFANRR